MSTIYVARSAGLSKWASEVGLSKNVFKIGCTEQPVKELVAAGWAGETDWQLVKAEDAAGLDEDVVLQRIARSEKVIEPRYYPRIRGTPGLFKVDPAHVERHILVGRALAGETERGVLKLKPGDFATYLIHNARK